MSLKFGNETFMDCHLSSSSEEEEDDDAFVAETRTDRNPSRNHDVVFCLEIDFVDDDFFFELKKDDDFDDDDDDASFREENATFFGTSFGFVAW